MRKYFFIFLIAQFLFINLIKSTPIAFADDSWKNFYNIAWRGTPVDNIKYAKQMGYDYIAVQMYYNKNNWVGNQDCAGLKFYVVDPQYWVIDSFGYSTSIYGTQTYTQAQKDWYNQNMVWKSSDTFPNNFATGWIRPDRFAVVWDFQQQAVIDLVVEKEIEIFHSFEDTSLPFTFAGAMFDSTRMTGNFYYWANEQNNITTLAYWTGTDSGIVHDSITHEYTTYSEGWVAYMKKLKTRMLEEFPSAKWILEPYWIYYTNNNDEWVNQIKNRADKDELTPDMLFQEGAGTQFVDTANNFNSGVNITKDMVGTTQPNKVGEYENRLYAAKAGINGAWYNWFRRFGGSSSGADYIPNFQNITEVSPRLKLIRCIPNWANLVYIPLVDRYLENDNGTVSCRIMNVSKNNRIESYISNKVMYGYHIKKLDKEIYGCFLENDVDMGTVTVSSGEGVRRIWSVNSYYEKDTNVTNYFTFSNNVIAPKASFVVEAGTGTGFIVEIGTKGKSYIEDGVSTLAGGTASFQ